MKSLLPNYVKKHNMFGMRSAQLLTDTKEPSTAKERQHKHAERRKASGKKQSKRVRENKLSGHFTEKKTLLLCTRLNEAVGVEHNYILKWR